MQCHTAAFEQRATLAQRQCTMRIEHHIEATSIDIRIEGAIVNDFLDAQRQRFIASGCTTATGDLCAAYPSDLHCDTPNSAKAARDEDPLAALQLSLVNQRGPGRPGDDGQSGS